MGGETRFSSAFSALLYLRVVFFSFMTKDEAHSSSASEGGNTNKAYLPHQGEKKEENEEGNGKGQEG